MARDITRQKQMEEELQQYRGDLEEQVQERTAVLAAINRIFREALISVTEEKLGRICLAAAKKLTGSKFGFICEADQAGSFQTIAINIPGWFACELPPAETSHLRENWELRGIPGQVIKSGETLICNDPASHPDWTEPSKGHPAITSFLGVPLKLAGQTCGMIGLANRKGGYDKQNQEDVEALAVAVVEALMRKRAEWNLAQLRRQHELILSSASEGILGIDLNGNMTFVNPAAAAMLGYEVEELLGRNAHDVWHHTKLDGSPYPPAECPVLETLRGGVCLPFEDDWFWRKDGAGFPVRCSRNPLIQNDQIAGAVVTFRDITARKQSEEALRQSEGTYRQIVETASEGIWTMDAENRVTFANSRIKEMLGYSLDEVIGEPISKFMDREWLEKASTLIIEHLREGVKEHLDFKLRHKEGRELWVIMTASPIFDPQGRYAGSLGMVTDITARKQAEEGLRHAKRALEEQESFLSSIFESIQDGISIVDPELNVLRVNRAKERDHAYAIPLVGKKCYEAFHEAKEPCAICPVRRTLQTGQADQEVVTVRLSGKEGLRHLNLLTFPLIDRASGTITGAVEYTRDITEQVDSEESLRESEQRFRDITEHAVEWIWEVDPEGKYTYSSPVVEQLLGYTPEEVLGKHFYDFFLPEEREELKDAALAAFGAKQPFRDFLNRNLRKNGETVWLSTSGVPTLDASGNLLGYRGADHDITARKQAEDSLRESEENYRLLVNQIPAVVFKGYADWSIDFFDNKIETITGYSKTDFDSRKLRWQELILPEDLEEAKHKFIKALKTDKSYVREYRIRRKDGEIRWVQNLGQIFCDAGGKIDHVSGVLLDITDRKQAEEALRQSLARLQKVMEEIVQTMALTVEIRDPYTSGHQHRVTQLTLAIAQEMGLDENRIEGLRVAGFLHDIGKIAVPAEILSKPGKLSEFEFSIVKAHVQVGYGILTKVSFPWPVAQIVLQHHEKLDGSGYPQGLHGPDILQEAKILAVADVVEAMASHRPYRPALGIDVALEEISRDRSTLFDPEVVDACLKVFKEKNFKFS